MEIIWRELQWRSSSTRMKDPPSSSHRRWAVTGDEMRQRPIRWDPRRDGWISHSLESDELLIDRVNSEWVKDKAKAQKEWPLLPKWAVDPCHERDGTGSDEPVMTPLTSRWSWDKYVAAVSPSGKRSGIVLSDCRRENPRYSHRHAHPTHRDRTRWARSPVYTTVTSVDRHVDCSRRRVMTWMTDGN